MKTSFDYSLVPPAFGLCAARDCPNASTCLRQMAFNCAPSDKIYLSILNPNRLASLQGKCSYYCSDKKVRYARGFMRTIDALTVRAADTFRFRMIEYLGRKNYYLKRRGDLKLAPPEQQWVIAVAKELGVVLDEYFDGYTEDYYWASNAVSVSK